jgi:hypothetical protein
MSAAASPAKTWGPFSGRQLTVIIVCLIVGVVMLPSAVWAVDAFTNVAVQDPVSGVKASVDASHHLFVTSGSVPLAVGGTVTAKESPYNALKHFASFVRPDTCLPLAAPSTSGTALVIKTAHVDTYLNPTPGSGNFVQLFYGPPANPCAVFVDDVNPSGIGVTVLDFGAGLALPKGDVLAGLSGGGVGADVSAFGFEIAGSFAPPNSPTAPTAQTRPQQAQR